MATQIQVSIDRNSPVPLYHQLAEQLAAAIDTGVLKPGDAFENELSIADRLDLSRPTVRRAIVELVTRGLLVRRRGIGTTVANEVIHRRNELTSLFDDLKRNGRKPLTEVLEFNTDFVDQRASQILGLPVETPLVYLERLRSVEEGPMSILRNWLPPMWADIDMEVLSSQGLYNAMKARGVVPAVAHQTIGARPAEPSERKLLQLDKTDPVLTMSRKAYDSAGNPVEFGDHCYRYDRYLFDITVYAS
ncbi:MAG TPA: GntR family transcriptional regulator [Propionicimonas sp.]|nr:GntR family transcriptional regulator [Propionicimonas sp.]HRA06586.1 GntR family transcriptional regulator [Propionicimonas sp.]